MTLSITTLHLHDNINHYIKPNSAEVLFTVNEVSSRQDVKEAAVVAFSSVLVYRSSGPKENIKDW